MRTVVCAKCAQCAGQCAAVRAAVCGSAAVRVWQCGSVRQCGSVWQCARQCAAVRAAVCGSVWQCVAVRTVVCAQCARQCAAVRLVVYGRARGSVRLYVGQCDSALVRVLQFVRQGGAAVRWCAAVCGGACGAVVYCGVVRQCMDV